jgi:hypothetical protein
VALIGPQYVLVRFVVVGLFPAMLAAAMGWATYRAGLGTLALYCLSALTLVVVVAADERYGRWDWRGAAAARSGPTPRTLVLTPGLTCAIASCEPGPWAVYFAPVRQVPERRLRRWQSPRRPLQFSGRLCHRDPRRHGQVRRGFRLVERRETDTYTYTMLLNRARPSQGDSGRGTGGCAASLVSGLRLVQAIRRSAVR